MSEVYISCDIESDGPIPGDYSMLSLGAAAFTSEGKLLSTFSVNLKTLPGASVCPDTMKWWASNQEAYDATRQDTHDPQQAMEQFVNWVNKLGGKPVFVGYPAGFDFLFIYWYMKHFGLESPFSFSALDIKTYAMCMLKLDYRQSTKKNMPKHWFPKEKHTHVAVDDAIEQGKLFCNMLKENTTKG
jgi:DNA polymerase III alpha subunit (gram-positive type)